MSTHNSHIKVTLHFQKKIKIDFSFIPTENYAGFFCFFFPCLGNSTIIHFRDKIKTVKLLGFLHFFFARPLKRSDIG